MENGSDERAAKCSGGSLLTGSMSGSVKAALDKHIFIQTEEHRKIISLQRDV